MVAEDVATGRFGRPVTTRFPPEPNGYLHFGHAKSLSLNFGLAAEFGGKCNLRFDDTNPFTEDIKYVEAIKHDIKWLGFQWDNEFYASDYFEKLYEIAEQLVKGRQGLRRFRKRRADSRRARHGHDTGNTPSRVSRIARLKRISTCCVACARVSLRTARTCCAQRSISRTRT